MDDLTPEPEVENYFRPPATDVSADFHQRDWLDHSYATIKRKSCLRHERMIRVYGRMIALLGIAQILTFGLVFLIARIYDHSFNEALMSAVFFPGNPIIGCVLLGVGVPLGSFHQWARRMVASVVVLITLWSGLMLVNFVVPISLNREGWILSLIFGGWGLISFLHVCFSLIGSTPYYICTSLYRQVMVMTPEIDNDDNSSHRPGLVFLLFLNYTLWYCCTLMFLASDRFALR